jgi:AcrR family transcriptional regulator
MPGTPRTEQTRRTREHIAATAMELFAQRGFERITVAEIATSAGVTEKTVFNHFATKEDLVYSRDHSFEEELVVAIRQRDPGVSVYSAATSFLMSVYTTSPADEQRQARHRVLTRLVATSPALQARERLILARYTAAVRDEIATEMAIGDEDLRPQVVAEAIISVHAAIVAGFRRYATADGAANHEVKRHLIAAEQAIQLLAGGLGGYGPQVTPDGEGRSSS